MKPLSVPVASFRRVISLALASVAAITGWGAVSNATDERPVSPRSATSARPAVRQPDPRIVSTIVRLLDGGTPAEALVVIERWYPDWANNPELSELRAKAQEQLGQACSNEACRFAATRDANRSMPTPARADALVAARQSLKAKLTLEPVPNEPPIEHLRRARTLMELAVAAQKAAGDDYEIQPLADSGLALARAERAKVALIGAAEEVVTEIMGELTVKAPNIYYREAGPVSIFVVYDAKRRCRGLYAVGSQKGMRSIQSGGKDPNGLLAQALGHPAKLKHPAVATQTVTRWSDGAVPIVVRWLNDAPIELRIGMAAP